jgi:hypothetical protein
MNPPSNTDSYSEETIIHQSDDYGFFCDIENIEPDEVIEYAVVYSIRSDYYHVCRKVTRKMNPTSGVVAKPKPAHNLHLMRPRTPTKRPPEYISPDVYTQAKTDKNDDNKNPYSRDDVIFSRRWYYYMYCIVIIAAIAITLILEL